MNSRYILTLLILCSMTTGNIYSMEWFRTSVNTVRAWLHLQKATLATPEEAELRGLINNKTNQNDYFKALDDAQEWLNNNKTSNQRYYETNFWKYRTEGEGNRKAQETQQTASILTALTLEEIQLRSKLKRMEKMGFAKAHFMQHLFFEGQKPASQQQKEKDYWKNPDYQAKRQKTKATRAAWDNFVDDQVLKGRWVFKYSNGYSAHDHLKDRILDLKEEYRTKLRTLLGTNTPNQEFISCARGTTAAKKNAEATPGNTASLYAEQINLESQNSDLKKLRTKIEYARAIVAPPMINERTQQARQNRKQHFKNNRDKSVYQPASAATATNSDE